MAGGVCLVRAHLGLGRYVNFDLKNVFRVPCSEFHASLF